LLIFILKVSCPHLLSSEKYIKFHSGRILKNNRNCLLSQSYILDNFIFKIECKQGGNYQRKNRELELKIGQISFWKERKFLMFWILLIKFLKNYFENNLIINWLFEKHIWILSLRRKLFLDSLIRIHFFNFKFKCFLDDLFFSLFYSNFFSLQVFSKP